QQLGVPPVKSEEFKYTPIMRELEKNFTFRETAVAPVTNDISEFLIPGVDAKLLVFVNGVYSPTLSSVKSSKLVIKSLDEALKEKDILAIEHYNQHSGMKSNGLVAWNTADWTSGMFIHVPDNSIVEEPVVFLYVNDSTAGEVIATHRNLIVAGRNSNATIVEKFNSVGGGNHFTNLVNEVVVNENAALEYYVIQN